jgi:60 kDa SS-A/Ro ribonucleoprotein
MAPADTVNEAGGRAYTLEAKQALAQYALTGCLNSTFYAGAPDQLEKTLGFCGQVDARFIAKTAIYARQKGRMKDMPALLCAVLSKRDPALLRAVFDRVIDDGRMLRNFAQILRSGVAGRKSLGSAPKNLIQGWFAARSDETVFKASVGQSPSLADVIKMTHPKPATPERAALYAYLVGRQHNAESLPPLVKEFEAYKAGRRERTPKVPFQMLTSLGLGPAEWKAIAQDASWQTTRMNLNTFARHGVFADKAATKAVASRLADPASVRRARVFPYQLLVAYTAAGTGTPDAVREALQDAMEVATENVPAIAGKVYVCPDVSGSMRSPVTGIRAGSTTAARCVDVAGLVAATILRGNPEAEVLPFQQDVVDIRLNPRDSVMTNAAQLAAVGGGGTNCSAPLARLNAQRATGDLVLFVSDNESWMDASRGRHTATVAEWSAFKRRNPRARLVCVDIQPHATTQAPERDDTLNIGGFSDQVFEVVAAFAEGRLRADHWVGLIEEVAL